MNGGNLRWNSLWTAISEKTGLLTAGEKRGNKQRGKKVVERGTAWRERGGVKGTRIGLVGKSVANKAMRGRTKHKGINWGVGGNVPRN